MSKRVCKYPHIGEVSYVKSRRAKRLTLSVRSWRGIRVTMPSYATYREAELFVKRNLDWLREKVAKDGVTEVDHFSRPNSAEREMTLNVLRKRALEYLPGRVALLAGRHGFSFRRVSVRRSRTRWGSCSSVNNLNLSIFLMTLPKHLSDYVILHELVHTVHKNHSSEFWQLLDRHTGGKARALAAEIRNYTITM